MKPVNPNRNAGAHSDSVIGWLNSEVAPSADVSVAVNEAGIAASLEASTMSENLPLPSASDVVTTSPRKISPSPLPEARLPNNSTVNRDSGLLRRAPCTVSPSALLRARCRKSDPEAIRVSFALSRFSVPSTRLGRYFS